MIGARLPDSALCNLNDKGIFPAFHGNYKKVKGKTPKTSFNYVAGYLYLSRLARKVKKNEYSIRETDSDSLGNVFTNLHMEGIISSEGINLNGEILDHNKKDKNNKKRNLPPSQWGNILKSRLYDENVSADDVSQSDDEFVKKLTKKNHRTKAL